MKKIIEFIKNTRISSRVLLIVWLFFSIIGSGFDPQEMKGTFPVLAVFFLFPAAINEFRKNQVFNSAHRKVKSLPIFKKFLFGAAVFCLFGSLLLLASSSIEPELVYGAIEYALISTLLFYFAFKKNAEGKNTLSEKGAFQDPPHTSSNQSAASLQNSNTAQKRIVSNGAIPLSEYIATANKPPLSVTHNNASHKERLAVLRKQWESGGKEKLAAWRESNGFGLIEDPEDFDDVWFEEFEENNIDETDIAFIDGMEGHTFEYYCADLLKKNNFVEVSVTRGSGDQGVDVLATKDGVKYAIQCKNYSTVLSNKPVQEVLAGKFFYNCHVAVVMTNSTFTPGAQELAKATGVLLWDRTVVQEMMGKK